jgi:hypothetical protein
VLQDPSDWIYIFYYWSTKWETVEQPSDEALAYLEEQLKNGEILYKYLSKCFVKLNVFNGKQEINLNEVEGKFLFEIMLISVNEHLSCTELDQTKKELFSLYLVKYNEYKKSSELKKV